MSVVPPPSVPDDMLESISRYTLYIGNLAPVVTESTLVQVFSRVGPVLGAKLIRNKATGESSGYGFIDFEERECAETALELNGQLIFERPIKVGWAQQSRKEELSADLVHIFVGDLAPEIGDMELLEAFSKRCPQVADARVMWDHILGKSRGYGFVSFNTREEAEHAITTMNGEALVGRSLRVNWATPKMTKRQKLQQQQLLSLRVAGFQGHPAIAAAVAAAAAAAGAGSMRPEAQAVQPDTVYVGNLTEDVSEAVLRSTFGVFGNIVEIRLNRQKGFAFVKYEALSSATAAVSAMQGIQLSGRTLRVGWGRERSLAGGARIPMMAPMSPYQQYVDQSMMSYPYMYASVPPGGSGLGSHRPSAGSMGSAGGMTMPYYQTSPTGVSPFYFFGPAAAAAAAAAAASQQSL